MANWVDIDVNSLLPGQPFTSSIALAYEENPRALAEGATGAPRVLGDALDKVFLGVIARSGTDSPIGFNDLDECRGLIFYGSYETEFATPSYQIDVRFSSDNGATYGSYQQIFGPDTTAQFRVFHIDLRTGAFAALDGSTDTLTVPAGVNAFQIRHGQNGSGDFFEFAVLKVGGAV